MRLLYHTVFDYKGVPLAAVAAEDCGPVEGEVEGVCEFQLGVR
jgi:hypothetical protein